jgi:hypothetical protein
MEFSSTEQTLTWFRDEYRNGTLDIRPPYQRAPVWADRQKNALIESVLLRLPIPEVYIQQSVDDTGDTTHGVVDGQQRIRTILQFIGVDQDEEDANDFVLDKLGAHSPWHGLSFADLPEDEKRRFWRYRLAVRMLETESDTEVRDMFKRLNKYTMPLKPQELRNATYVGPFARLATAIADESDYWAENLIVSAQSIRRMGDIEFVAELLIGVLHGPQGGSAAIIDEYYAEYEDYEDEFPEQRATRSRFNASLKYIERVFPEIRKIRWHNKTDFYSLFVAVAHLLREHGSAPARRVVAVRRELTSFADEVEVRQADEDAPVPPEVQRYVRALTRGANDKARRGERHLALLARLEPVVA